MNLLDQFILILGNSIPAENPEEDVKRQTTRCRKNYSVLCTANANIKEKTKPKINLMVINVSNCI